jgi:hypothetical protein
MDELSRAWDYVKLLLPAAMIAMMGSLIKFLREHRAEPFSWGDFLSGMATAAFAGVIVHHLQRSGGGGVAFIAAVAMAGYGGGKTIDLLMDAVAKRAGGK